MEKVSCSDPIRTKSQSEVSAENALVVRSTAFVLVEGDQVLTILHNPPTDSPTWIGDINRWYPISQPRHH